MVVEVKETPNPNALMFLPGRDVLGPNSGTMSFTDQQSALASPLALALFDHVPAVTIVRPNDSVPNAFP